MARPVSTDDARSAMTRASRIDFVLSGLAVVTFFARFYLPAESTAQGETLWIVGLWLVIGLAASVAAWRGGCVARRLDWLDGSLLLLIGGQVASAIVVVATTGDKRAAIDVAWEWFGLGIVWFVLRPRLASSSFRESFVRASIVTGVVLSGLGLWQHYVTQPQLAAKYGPLFDRLRTASGSEAEAIQRELGAVGIPTEGPGLILYEKRLRDSREPVGFFGLANTLGGCLAVWLVLALSELFVAWSSGRATWRLALSLIAVALIAWCLLLTKSRTAAIGAGCGTALLLAGNWSPTLRLRRAMMIGGVGVGLLIGVVGALFQFGGLDREVLSEAPKSLAYRLQYWQATSRLVADHVWLGVGPGNFRQHYLKYKLPEASEEIADPHNLFFDVAATGGVISLIGLVMLIGWMLFARGAGKRSALEDANSEPPVRASRSIRAETPRPSLWVAGLGPLLGFAGLLGLNGEWDDRPLVLTGIWFAVAWMWRLPLQRDPCVGRDSTRPCFAAFVALTIHLLGAGGIAMPAVSQLWLALMACSRSNETVPAIGSRRPPTTPLARAALACLMLAVLMSTALIPVARCGLWVSKGDREIASSSWKVGEVMRNYVEASRADPLSPEPRRRLAEMAFRVAEVDRFQSNEFFDTAVRLQLEAIACDPHNFQGPRTLGNWWMARWRVSQAEDDARQAAKWLRRARDSYPTNASILAEFAVALEAGGQRGEAVETARRAMVQDKLNRKLGHVDRYLANELLSKLRGLAEEPEP